MTSEALAEARLAIEHGDRERVVDLIEHGFMHLGPKLSRHEERQLKKAIKLLDALFQDADDEGKERIQRVMNPLLHTLGLWSVGMRRPSSFLGSAAANGNVDELLRWLNLGEPIDALDPRTGETPLMAAAREGYREVVQVLLDRGAHPTRKGALGANALHLAAEGGHLEVVDLLLATNRMDLSVVDGDGRTALDWALTCSNTEVSRRLDATDGREHRTDFASARNYELEAVIRSNPEEVEAFSIYADWLLERNDPRGEWIMLEQRGDATSAASVGERFRAQIDPRIQTEWKLGFVRSARLDDFDLNGFDVTIDRALRRFLKLSSSAFLCSLTFARVRGAYWICYDRLFEVLSDEPTPSLETLIAGDFTADQAEISFAQMGDLSRLYRSAPRLRRLRLQGIGVRMGAIDLPELREFELCTTSISLEAVKAIASARWPKLERMTVWFGQALRGAEGGVADLAPVLRADGLPKLKHLALMNAEFTDELAEALRDAPLLPQLETLSLAKGTLCDAGARALEQPPFRNLRSIDVSGCFLSEEAVARLARFPTITATDQRSEDEGRYAAVAE